MQILSVFGTRSEAIKLAPVIRELRRPDRMVCKVCVTAQHQVLRLFDILPDTVLILGHVQ